MLDVLLLGLLPAGFLIAGYAHYRNHWVYTHWKEFHELVHDWLNSDLEQNFEYMHAAYDYTLASYNDMMGKWWIWDINKFVRNKQLWDKIHGNA